MKELQEFFSNLRNTFPTVGIWDILDVLVVAVLIYWVINLIWNTSARRIAWAIVIMLLATLVTEILNLHTVNYLLDRVLQLGFVALVIVFQPELRRLLERVGSRGTVKGLMNLTSLNSTDETGAIDQVVLACQAMSKERVGALIVFERSNSLEQVCASGTMVDAAVSQELIRNIFFPKASLHDGAMVIHEGRIQAAGCVLPLSDNRNLSTDLGTRHRAGVGMSEASDAVVVIVSEETGTISVAMDGMLKRHLATETLRKLLNQELVRDDSHRSPVSGVLKVIKRKSQRKGDDSNAAKS